MPLRQMIFIGLCMLLYNPTKAQKVIAYENKCSVVLPKAEYDTVEGAFFYEDRIEAYREGESFLKHDGYVRAVNDLYASYLSGYYILDTSCLESMRLHGNNISYNSTSINAFLASQLYESAEDSPDIVVRFNPYCGVLYKKYFLKMVVCKLGVVRQRLPFFEDCEQLMKRKNQTYKIENLPTYLITNILEYRKE